MKASTGRRRLTDDDHSKLKAARAKIRRCLRSEFAKRSNAELDLVVQGCITEAGFIEDEGFEAPQALRCLFTKGLMAKARNVRQSEI